MTQKLESFKKLLLDVRSILDITEEDFMDENVPSFDNLTDYRSSGKYDDLSFEDDEKVKLFTLAMQGAECVDEYGGEGQGDDYYAVWHFPHLDLYVKFQGWYASSMGPEYEECYEVAPQEVTVIKYNRV